MAVTPADRDRESVCEAVHPDQSHPQYTEFPRWEPRACTRVLALIEKVRGEGAQEILDSIRIKGAGTAMRQVCMTCKREFAIESVMSIMTCPDCRIADAYRRGMQEAAEILYQTASNGYAIPPRKHLCGSCDLTDEEWTEAEAHNRGVEASRKAILAKLAENVK